MALKNMRTVIWILILLLLNAAGVLGAGPSEAKIEPAAFNIGTFFHGQPMRFSGLIAADQDVIIEIKGPGKKEHFHMKGKVGPFWMNREKIAIDRAPFLYGLLLPAGKKWSTDLPALGVGFGSIQKDMIIVPRHLDAKLIFNRFVQMKKAVGLYHEQPAAIGYTPVDRDKKKFAAKFIFPSATLPGHYSIVMTVLHDGRVQGRSFREFAVEEVGAIRAIRDFAYEKELFYGIACVVIALFAGMVMGLFFKGSGGH